MFNVAANLSGPPDVTNALQMLFEGLEMRQKRKAEESQNLLAQSIGGQLSGGDYTGAANTAFQSGNVATGLKIHELSQNERKEFAETVLRHVEVATPETWPGLRQKLIELTDEDPGEDLEAAKAGIRADYADIDTIMSGKEKERDNARADEQLDLSRQRLELAQKQADPAVIAEQTKARTAAAPPRSRVLPQNSINALGEVGTQFDNFRRLPDTFKDNYGGYVSETGGNIANTIGRISPFASEDAVERANWWQDYQNQKNIIRNKLFGSALTATEKAEFDKANINPGMRSDLIKKNLERQHVATTKAARKLANVYVQQGYRPEVIEAAIGVPLEDLGLGDLVAAPAGAATEQMPNVDDENSQPPAGADPELQELWQFLTPEERQQYLDAGG